PLHGRARPLRRRRRRLDRRLRIRQDPPELRRDAQDSGAHRNRMVHRPAQDQRGEDVRVFGAAPGVEAVRPEFGHNLRTHSTGAMNMDMMIDGHRYEILVGTDVSRPEAKKGGAYVEMHDLDTPGTNPFLFAFRCNQTGKITMSAYRDDVLLE